VREVEAASIGGKAQIFNVADAIEPLPQQVVFE
jgi:hypothetical protein